MLDPHLSCVQNVGPYPCSVGLFAYVCWQTPACFASCVDVTAEVQNLRHSPHPALRAGKMQMRSISFFCIQGRTEEPPQRDTWQPTNCRSRSCSLAPQDELAIVRCKSSRF